MWNTKNKVSLSPKLKLGVGRGYLKDRVLKIVGTICFLLALALGANALKLLFFSTAKQTTISPRVAGASETFTASTEIEVYKDYTVQKGDTLFNVSQKVNIPWTTLAELNKIKPPFSLKPGQVIKIPNNK